MEQIKENVKVFQIIYILLRYISLLIYLFIICY